jgi:hypothetical protein
MAFRVILRVITQPNINLIENDIVNENIIVNIHDDIHDNDIVHDDDDDEEIMHEPTILEIVITYFNIICGTTNRY